MKQKMLPLHYKSWYGRNVGSLKSLNISILKKVWLDGQLLAENVSQILVDLMAIFGNPSEDDDKSSSKLASDKCTRSYVKEVSHQHVCGKITTLD